MNRIVKAQQPLLSANIQRTRLTTPVKIKSSEDQKSQSTRRSEQHSARKSRPHEVLRVKEEERYCQWRSTRLSHSWQDS